MLYALRRCRSDQFVIRMNTLFFAVFRINVILSVH